MAKHIHIHLPRRVARKTSDAFEEAKHKRDDGGRFATVAGAGDPNFHKAGINHSPAMKHHGEAEAHHHMAAQAEFEKNGESEVHRVHKEAASAHASALEEAKQRATGFGGPGYEAAAKKAAEASAKTMAQSGGTKSKAGPGTETHHSKLKPGDSLHDKNGQKIDHVESIGGAMHAGERTIHTRAGYQHRTQGGHLPDGMHAKPSSYTK